MPFYTRPGIDEPALDSILWRYMDYPRFLALLMQSSLTFIRSDSLGDQYEGFVSEHTLATRSQRYPEKLASLGELFGMFDTHGNRLDWYVSCWHESNLESMQMWDTYGASGLAVRTTFQRLTEALAPDMDVIGGRVTYSDFATSVIPDQFAWSPLLHKQVEYRNESEVRLLARNPNGGYRMMGENGVQMDVFARPAPDISTTPVALAVPVNLIHLIEAVVTGPHTPEWQTSPLRRILDTCSLDGVPIIRSRLGSGVAR